MGDFIITRDKISSAISAQFISSVRVSVNKSLQVDYISSKTGNGIVFNDSLTIPIVTFPSGGILTLGPNSIVDLGENSSLCVDVIKPSKSGSPIQINGSLVIDKISPNTGSVLSIGGSLCIEAGKTLLVDRIKSKSGSPIQIDTSLVLDPEVIFVNNIFPSTGSLLSINSSVCVAASGNLAVDTIVSKTGNIPITIDDSLCVTGTLSVNDLSPKTGTLITTNSSLCVNGEIQVDTIRGKSTSTTIDNSLCVNGSLAVNVISSKTGTVLTVNNSLCINGEIQVDTIKGKSTSTTIDNSLCVNGSLAVDVISSKTGTVLTVNNSLIVSDISSSNDLSISSVGSIGLNASSVTVATGAGGFILPHASVNQLTNINTAVTINSTAGLIETQTATTGAQDFDTFLVNNNRVTSSSIVIAILTGYSPGVYGTNGLPVINVNNIGTGAFEIVLINTHDTNALNGTVQIAFLVV